MYEEKQADTLRIVAPADSRFYLVKYKDSYNLKCSGVARPILYRITEFKLINEEGINNRD
jgi:hypothetical protein